MSKATSVENFHEQFAGINSAWRFLSVVPLAIFIMAVLLLAMQQLIHMENPSIEEPRVQKIPPINMNIPTTVTVRESEPPVRPVIVEPPPIVKSVMPVEVTIEPGVPGIGGPIIPEKSPISGTFGTAQMIPFIKVPPQYPQSALAKGVEGYVDVIFDVTELGTTDNIRILGYEPSSVFNRSVIKAIKNWKYKPNVVDGVPVRTPDVRDRIRFNMENN